jgi:LuxR family quorum-sensing transcriptional regulator LasR
MINLPESSLVMAEIKNSEIYHFQQMVLLWFLVSNRKSSSSLRKKSSVNLTKREKDILKYCILGYTAKRIGRILFISYRTVEKYINTLKIKFFCDTKGELIEKAIKSGFIIDINICE